MCESSLWTWWAYLKQPACVSSERFLPLRASDPQLMVLTFIPLVFSVEPPFISFDIQQFFLHWQSSFPPPNCSLLPFSIYNSWFLLFQSHQCSHHKYVNVNLQVGTFVSQVFFFLAVFKGMNIVAHLNFPHSSRNFWSFFRMWCILLCSYVRWRVIY